MTLMNRLVFSGLHQSSAAAIQGITQASLAVTAGGNAQGNATALTAEANLVTTVGSGEGVILPATADVGDEIWVVNGGANALSVYPPSGGAINNNSANAAHSLATKQGARFLRVSSTVWLAVGK